MTVEPDGKANLNLRSGTVRLWFKPWWNSGVGPGVAAKLIEVGSKGGAQTNGWWSLFVNSTGDSLSFASQTNNMAEATNLTAAISFESNTSTNDSAFGERNSREKNFLRNVTVSALYRRGFRRGGDPVG